MIEQELKVLDGENQPESFLGLSGNKQLVAIWLATPILDSYSDRGSLKTVALDNGVPISSLYRYAKSPDVLEAARDLISACIQVEKVPVIWQGILLKAVSNADFGLKVLKFLRELGVDIYIGKSVFSVPSPDDPDVEFDLHIPGGLEAAIIAMRRRVL